MWIGDQFAKNKAEQLGLLDIAKIFSPTPETAILERPTNHLLLGAKGSGKSTLLRALTWPVWQSRPSTYPAQFIGIYLPIRYEDASHFRIAYDELQNSTLFEHFFVISLLFQAAHQLKEAQFPEETIMAILLDYVRPAERSGIKDLNSLALRFLRERDQCISTAKNNPSIELSDLELITDQPLGISKIQYLAEQITTGLSRPSEQGTKRFGILIDSLDYYGSLTTMIAPLFESDSSSPVVVKAAARSLDASEFASRSRSRRLEFERDFEILSLDREPDNEEHLRLLRDAVCRRARHNAPPDIASLSDDQILRVLFDGSADDSEDLASFNSFSRLSSGNVLQVILLLDEAATIHKAMIQKLPDGIVPISRSARLKAIEQESRKFWDLELGVRLPSKRLEAKVYCETLVEAAKTDGRHESLLAPSFMFNSIPEEHQSLLAALLSSRVLIASDPIVHKTLQAGFPYTGPITLELNRLMIHAVGMRPLKGNLITLDPKDFHRKFSRELQETKPHLSPKSTHSRAELFSPDFTVFISLPFDQRKKNRTTVLRKAINKIYEETTGKPGTEGLSYVDIHYIPHVGSFRFDIPKYINEATYVVADISEIGLSPTHTGGIFYEIGLSIGHKKPLALFYNSKDASFGIPQFNSGVLPKLLTGQTVINLDESVTNFIHLYRPIHEKLIGFNGYLEFPLGVARTPEPLTPPPYAYLSFQPRNEDAYTWITQTIRTVFPELTVVKARNWEADDAPSFFQAISNASFCIIDCTQGVNNYAIELGVCAALEWRKVLEVWDSNTDRRPNPISMFPGKRFAWTDFSQNDARQLTELIKHLARTTTLGMQRI